MDFSFTQNPLVFFFLVLIVVTVFLTFYSNDMYLFVLPIIALLIYLSYNGFIQSWIWVAIGLASSVWFSVAILKGGSN